MELIHGESLGVAIGECIRYPDRTGEHFRVGFGNHEPAVRQNRYATIDVFAGPWVN